MLAHGLTFVLRGIHSGLSDRAGNVRGGMGCANDVAPQGRLSSAMSIVVGEPAARGGLHKLG